MAVSAAVMTVSQLAAHARQLLESGIGRIWLQGEIGSLSKASSGHWYFNLKDNHSQLRCAMFRQRNIRVSPSPKEGDAVLVQAQVSLYEPRGEFQLIVEQLLPAGEGSLKARFEALKALLASEGLFDSERKRPLPPAPSRIGVITSATGAAIHDIITVLGRRDPSLAIVIYPVLVQGQQAATQIARAIALANRRQEVDLLIVGRGGGSAEDLFCFNEAEVVRAIAASELPVVSAVGHETDTTLACLAADRRAPTPSAAAELVSRDRSAERQRLLLLEQRLRGAVSRQLQRQLLRQQQLDARLTRQHPQRRWQQQSQRLDELQLRLQRALRAREQQLAERFGQLQARLQRQHPQQLLNRQQQRLQQLSDRARRALLLQQQHCQQRFTAAANALNLISPLATLGRGYAIAFDGRGQLLRQVAGLQPGQQVGVRLQDGHFTAHVITINPSQSDDAPSTPAMSPTNAD